MTIGSSTQSASIICIQILKLCEDRVLYTRSLVSDTIPGSYTVINL